MCFGKERYLKKPTLPLVCWSATFLRHMFGAIMHLHLCLLTVIYFVRLSARPEERITSEFAVWMQNGNNLHSISKRMGVWEPGASCGPALNTASCLHLGGWSVLLARAPRSMSDCGVKNDQI